MNKKEIKIELALFAEFLLKRSMVTAGKEKYYVIWLRRFFLKQKQLEGKSWEEWLRNFIELLVANPGNASWQVNQAEHAVRLYYVNFRSLQSANGISQVQEQNTSTKKWVEENFLSFLMGSDRAIRLIIHCLNPINGCFLVLEAPFQKALSLAFPRKWVGVRNHPGIPQESDKCHNGNQHSRYSGIVAYFLRNRLGETPL